MVNSGLLFYFFASRVQTFSPAAAAEPTHSNCQEREKKPPKQSVVIQNTSTYIHTWVYSITLFVHGTHSIHLFADRASRLPTLPSLPPAAGSFARSLNPGFPNRISTAVIRIIAFPIDLNLPPPRANYNSTGFRSPLAIQIKVNIIFWFIYLAIRAYRTIRSKSQKKGLLCTIPVLCCAVLYDNRGVHFFFPSFLSICLLSVCPVSMIWCHTLFLRYSEISPTSVQRGSDRKVR